MNLFRHLKPLLLLVFLLPAASAQERESSTPGEVLRESGVQPFAGGWIGDTKNGSLTAIIRLCIRPDQSAGSLSTVDLPEFGYFDLPIELETEDEQMTVVFSRGEASVRLVLLVRGDVAAGRWEGAGAPGDVRLKRTEECGPRYRAQAISFTHEQHRLAGTLLLPTGLPGPYPAVVWTHGSGSIDRSNPTYRGLAVSLTELGIASLIYDKRGVGASTGNAKGVSMHDLAADAVAGVEMLRKHPAVRADLIGVGGISQGGWISPTAAAQSPTVRFVAGLSAPGVSPAEQNLFNQHNKVLKAGFSKAIAERADAILRKIYHYYLSGEGRAAVEAALEEVADEPWSDAAYELAFWRRRGLAPLSASYRGDLFFDPEKVWSRVTVPTIGIWGEADALVPADVSEAVIRRALDSAGNTDRNLLIFPRTDHSLRLPPSAPWTWGFLHPGYRAAADFILSRAAKTGDEAPTPQVRALDPIIGNLLKIRW